MPPLGWAGVIFILTSIPSPQVPHLFPGADKLVHFALYAVLGFLLARAVLRESASGAVVIAFALLVGIAAGALDEWHQQFIPGRSMELADWEADAVGSSVGVSIATVLYRRARLAHPT